jgi:hypothetical protein
LQKNLGTQISDFTGLYSLQGADEVSREVVLEKSLSYILPLIFLKRCETGTVHHAALVCACVCVWGLFRSLVLCFFFPSLEFSVARSRIVNLAFVYGNRDDGDFLILVRHFFPQKDMEV